MGRFAFGLRFHKDSDSRLGFSEQVQESPEHAAPTDLNLSQFGALLAYCYAFGIQDLHCDNVVLAKDGPQVVDTEVVFTRLLLPHETLLLPFKRSGFDVCGLSKLLPGRRLPLGESEASGIIEGFIAGLLQLDQCATPLGEILTREMEAYLTPIRVILRSTRDYRHVDLSQWEVGPLAEETLQMARGDIPYFFTTVAEKKLFYYSSPDGEKSIVELPTHYQPALDRAATDPCALIGRPRLRRELFPNGTLFLARKLLSSTMSLKIHFKHGLLQRRRDSAWAIESDWGNYVANLQEREGVEGKVQPNPPSSLARA